MLTTIIGFLFGLAVGVTAQEIRRPHSRAYKFTIGGLAIVLTMCFFAYSVGWDMAQRDNLPEAAIFSVGDNLHLSQV